MKFILSIFISILVLLACGNSSNKKTTEQSTTSKNETQEETTPKQNTYSFKGKGNDVLKADLKEGLLIVEASHKGSSNFVVEIKDADGQLVDIVANEIGTVSGAKKSSRIPSDGNYILDIMADGSWEIELN